jgi:hypothetical protein
MGGNIIDCYMKGGSSPHKCTLNPGIITSKGSDYCILRFEYRNYQLPYEFNVDDSIKLLIDGSEINLIAYDVRKTEEKLTAYYTIDRWDIVDIGNANNVHVIIPLEDVKLRSHFSKKNIYNYKYFAAKYILKTDDIPDPYEPEYRQPWGFVAGGLGTGYEFWLGYYTNFILVESEMGDYFAIGAGFSPFEYWRSSVIDKGNFDIRYLYDGKFTRNSYYINLMYGLTHLIPQYKMSIETGITFQYYFHDKNWDQNFGTSLYPTKYEIEKGVPYYGPALGIFLQIGVLWVQVNTKSNYAAGMVLPVPWW